MESSFESSCGEGSWRSRTFFIRNRDALFCRLFSMGKTSESRTYTMMYGRQSLHVIPTQVPLDVDGGVFHEVGDQYLKSHSSFLGWAPIFTPLFSTSIAIFQHLYRNFHSYLNSRYRSRSSTNKIIMKTFNVALTFALATVATAQLDNIPQCAVSQRTPII